MFFFALLHFYLVPQSFWPFGLARPATKPAPSTGTMIFGFLALCSSLVGAAIGAKRFVDWGHDSVNHPVTGVLGVLFWLVQRFEAGLAAIGFPVAQPHSETAGLKDADEFVSKFYNLFLDGVYQHAKKSIPKPNGFEGDMTDAKFEYQFLVHAALLAALAVGATWTVMALDWITADKQVLNPVRKFADGALSVVTAACSLAGAVVVTAIYTFDAFFLFSCGYLVMFNYPWVFRVAGVAMAAGALGYVYWIGTFSKSLWEMHTFGLTIACAMALNSLLFYVVCDASDVNGSVTGDCWKVRDAGWQDNFNPLNWEPSFVLFLVFLRSFMHATAALGSSLSDRIDGGPETYFKHGVANLYQVKAAMFDSFDVLVRLVPLAMLFSGVKLGTAAASPAVKFVTLCDNFWKTNIVVAVLAIVTTVLAWIGAVFWFVLSAITTARELLLTDFELTLLVGILYVSTKIAFGSDNEDRYNPLGDITKYFNTAVATVSEAVPVLSAKKAAPSPKAAPAARAGSAKRK